MKKALSVVLSICLLLTSISTVLTQSVFAAESTIEVVFDENTILGTPADVSTFYDTANWYYSSDTTKNMFDESIQESNLMSTVTDVDYDGDGKALKGFVYARQAYISFNVKKNTNYRLSFYVKSTSMTGPFSENSCILNPTFIATGTTGAPTATWLTKVGGVHEFVTTAVSYQAPTAEAYRYTVAPRKASVDFAVSPDEWTEISYTFNSGDNETLYYALRGSTKAENLYFDGFQLLEDYYNPEDVIFWRTFHTNQSPFGNAVGGETTFYGLDGLTATQVSAKTEAGSYPGGAIGYCTAADNFNDTETDNGYSIHSYGANRHYSVSFPTLKPNTKYKLSFGVRTSNNLGIRYSVAANGSTLTAATTFSPAALVSVYNDVTADAFKQFTCEFTTNDTNYEKLWLTFYGNNPHAFYDNIKLEEYVPPKKHKVTFNTNCDLEINALEGYEGDALTLPTDLTREDYYFTGWYTDEALSNPFTATTFPAEDITLYAKWIKGVYRDYENLSYWGSYTYNADPDKNPVIDGTAIANNSGWNSVNNDTANTYSGSGQSIKINGNITHAVVSLPTLKPYTKYTFSFKYMIPSTCTTGSQWFNSFVFKKGYTMDAALPTTAYATGTKPTASADGSWNDYSVEFNTDDTTDYFFSVYPRMSAGFLVYLDEIVLIENGALYENPINITFNTNGGSDIPVMIADAGKAVTMPAAPTKSGFAFAGWYTDEALTNQFLGKVAPETDITLYAKWIVGSYQDFENYTAIVGGNFTAMTDGENAYSGNGYLKYSATEKDVGSSRFVVSGTEALKDFATPGDQIKLSFKYKLLSGDARYYLHTSATGNQITLTKATTGAWLNAYKYKELGLTVSEEWQTMTVTYDLKSYSEIAAGGFTFDDFLYTVLIFSSDNGAELYIDDIALDMIPGIKVKTAYNNAAAIRSAEASSTGKNGIRIYNEIDTHWVEAKNIVEYGSVAAFSSKIDGEITVENGNKGIAYSDGTLSAEKYTIWESTADTVVFTSYLTNIAAARYDENILIRSYAIAADGTIYYGATITVSVFEVANAIDNANTVDGSEPTEADANAFYAFITNANHAKYAAWCAENEKTIGTLYNNRYAA